MTYQRWTVALSTLVGIALVAAGAVGAGTAWASAQAVNQRRAAAEMNERKADADAQAAAAEREMTAVRLAFDPDVAAATATLTDRLEAAACDQAKAMVRAGKAVPAGSALARPALDAAADEFPALAEVPGWEAKVDLAAVDQRAEQCAAAATRAKKQTAARKATAAAATAAGTAQEQADDDWVTIESNSPEGKERVYDPDHTIRNGGSDPDRCIHDGKQYCSD